MSKLTLTERVYPLLKCGLVVVSVTGVVALGGCNSTKESFTHGYQLNEDSLTLVPEGSSREQVLLSLGTPSTTQTQTDGSETFYYISQNKVRPVAFITPKVVDQRILAVYMNKESTVERIANYGLKDGKAFDYVRRVTPTGGKDLSFLNQLLNAVPSASGILGKK